MNKLYIAFYMKRIFLLSIIIILPFLTYSQESNNKKQKSLLNKAKNISQEENLKDVLIDAKDEILEDKIDLLLKEIENMNKEFEKDFSSSVDKLLKENKNYLDQLENEYKTKLKDEYDKISELKKSVDEILKIKDLELKIVDKKIDEINKNLKRLSSDEFIKNFKKEFKKKINKFKTSTIEYFEEQLDIKLDTINNE